MTDQDNRKAVQFRVDYKSHENIENQFWIYINRLSSHCWWMMIRTVLLCRWMPNLRFHFFGIMKHKCILQRIFTAFLYKSVSENWKDIDKIVCNLRSSQTKSLKKNQRKKTIIKKWFQTITKWRITSNNHLTTYCECDVAHFGPLCLCEKYLYSCAWRNWGHFVFLSINRNASAHAHTFICLVNYKIYIKYIICGAIFFILRHFLPLYRFEFLSNIRHY